MGTKQRAALIFAVVFALCLAFPGGVFAEAPDVLSLFRFDFGVQEEYTDNVDFRAADKRDDWLTRVYAGVRLSTELAPDRAPGQVAQAPMGRDRSGINLDYRLTYNHYAKDTYDYYIGHEGRLDAWTTIGRRVVLRLRDSLLRSDEPLELQSREGAPAGDYLPGSQRIRGKYIRNVLEPSMEYQFARESLFSFAYRNNYYENKSDLFEDSQEHALTPRLDLWFNIRHGISLEYVYSWGDFDRSPDFVGHIGRARYNYRFSPRTSVFAEHLFVTRDFDDPGVDYDVHNPAVGIRHSFTPTTDGSLQVGYFWQKPEIGDKQEGVSVAADLNTRTRYTDFSLSLRGGFREDYFTALNAGLSKYYGAYGTIRHRLAQRFSVGIAGSVAQDEYPSDEKILRWEARGNATYQPLRWLFFTLEALHREDNPNRGPDIKENRAILRINLTI